MRPLEYLVIVGLLGLGGLLALPSCAHAQASEKNTVGEGRTVQHFEARARARELGERDYAPHDFPRKVSGEVDCPEIELIEYEGEVIDYNQTIEVNADFRKRLIRFEKLVAEIATNVYGRPPARIVHAGGHTCRTVGGRGEKLSEHAFGHAIDVIGFDFEALPEAKGDSVARIATAFEVRLEDHWGATSGFEAKHALFLHLLAEELVRRGPFSTMLGPAYPGHDKMFHFDFGPQFFFRL